MGSFDAVNSSLWGKPRHEQPHARDLERPANNYISELRNKFTSPRKAALSVEVESS